MAHRLRLAALLMLVFALFAPAGHVLEIPGKLRLGAEAWLVVQQNLYPGYAVAGAVSLLGAPLACAAFAWSVRGTAEARAAWIAAALVLAGLAAWALIVAPVNTEVAAAAPGSPPPGWIGLRNRWEAGHATVFVLVAAGFLVLLRAVLAHARAASTSAARSAGQA
ncbi:hypothetical protein [Falsiroseomonas sp.]|uniref:hypothetical protein n=1 Tax=Falsiroseomonas sp. TaxID=2870721 RepID=UPI00356B5531